MFAPTPPLESLRIVLSLAATWTEGTLEHNRREDSEDRSQISFIDIARAYFCAKTDPERPTYVELPLKEDVVLEDLGELGLLDTIVGAEVSSDLSHTSWLFLSVRHLRIRDSDLAEVFAW